VGSGTADVRSLALNALMADLARMEPDAHGLTVLPFIAGERSPGWAAEAALTLHGVELQTKPADIAQRSVTQKRPAVELHSSRWKPLACSK
jgi:sugar (pentulose or hexulose) kinase